MPHAKTDPVKHCKVCGVLMTRKRYPGGDLEANSIFAKREHCSQSCANTKTNIQANSHRWRARQLKPRTACETCGTTMRLHVHHVDRNPANNDPANLQTLCASCHLKLHWREDREKRVASAKRAAARPGANTRPRSTDGRFCSADQRQSQQS